MIANPILVTGIRTTIIQELIKLLPADSGAVWFDYEKPIIGDAHRYVFAAGVLYNKPLSEQTGDEIAESLFVNMVNVITACEYLLEHDPHARICVIGSKAGEAGSYDQTYAAAKAGIHNYVRNARIIQDQQIVCIAPTIIMDSGMTRRRNNEGIKALEMRRKKHPKKRYLQAIEVARLIYFLLYIDQGFITNTVIKMKGGPGWW
jgi:NAD(P)-dependent dehydrogenase (short-subunit alcohol dehydrogenase family)